MVGAQAIQVGTANFIKPDICIDIIEGIEDYMISEGIKDLSEIRGIIIGGDFMNINVLDILKESGALLEGHFLLSSGRHSNRYCQCAKLLQYPDKSEKVLSVVVEKT